MAYPKLQINYLTHSQLADNIWHAQMAAHPRVLTYAGPDIVLRRETRHAALHFNHGGSLFEIPMSSAGTNIRSRAPSRAVAPLGLVTFPEERTRPKVVLSRPSSSATT
jgi:hypothetical protein